jgi:arabinan endo-1,5-alpha-L-arabinosidase
MRYNLLASVLAAATTVSAYADPMACTGSCQNKSHDPALIRRDDGTYFRFATAEKITIHSAPALSGPWKEIGPALPEGSKLKPMTGWDDLWAPDVTKVGDTYYMYYTVSKFKTAESAIGVATSTDLESWTDHGATSIKSDGSQNYNAIDANLYYDGKKFIMSYGSFWNDIFQVEMEDPPLTMASGSTPKNVAFQPAGEHAREGPFITTSGDYHYLFWSEGKCCGFDADRPAKGAEYKIMACRASSAEGPFVDKDGKSCMEGGGTTVLESHGFVYGPGGQGVYWDEDAGAILYYHYVDTRVGYADGDKKFGMNKIDFSSGWPVV